MFSKTTKYAIKAVIYLGMNSNAEKKILTRDMYKEVKVSESYLAKILQDMARHGIISSTKGKNGGFYLDESNYESTLLDIVRVTEGSQSVDSCVLGISRCNLNKPCPLHNKIGKYKTEFNQMLEETRIRELVTTIPEDFWEFPK